MAKLWFKMTMLGVLNGPNEVLKQSHRSPNRVQIELWSERTIFESNMKKLGSKMANFESKTAELELIKATSGFKKVKLGSQMAVFLGSNIVNLGSKIGVSVPIMIQVGSKMAL